MYTVSRTVAMSDNLAGQPLSALAPKGIDSTANTSLVASKISPIFVSSKVLSQPTTVEVASTIPREVTNVIVIDEHQDHEHCKCSSCIPKCVPKCEPKCELKVDPCDPCSSSRTPIYGGWGWGWLGSIILWGIIFTVLFWLIFYSLKPPFVLQTDSNQVDTAKVLLAAVIAAIILVAIILLIKFLINRSRAAYYY